MKISLLLPLFFLILSCKQPATDRQVEKQLAVTIEEEQSDTDSYNIQAVMLVDHYSVHYVLDKMQKNSVAANRNKIKIYGKTGPQSTHPLVSAIFWFDNRNPKITYNKDSGYLEVMRPVEEFQQFVPLLDKQYQLTLSYSLSTSGDEHILLSTRNKNTEKKEQRKKHPGFDSH